MATALIATALAAVVVGATRKSPPPRAHISRATIIHDIKLHSIALVASTVASSTGIIAARGSDAATTNGAFNPFNFEMIKPVENDETTPADLFAFREQSERSTREAIEDLQVVVRKLGEQDFLETSALPLIGGAQASLRTHLPILGEIAAYKNTINRPPPLLQPLNRLKERFGGKPKGEALNLIISPADIERMETLEGLCEDITDHNFYIDDCVPSSFCIPGIMSKIVIDPSEAISSLTKAEALLGRLLVKSNEADKATNSGTGMSDEKTLKIEDMKIMIQKAIIAAERILVELPE